MNWRIAALVGLALLLFSRRAEAVPAGGGNGGNGGAGFPAGFGEAGPFPTVSAPAPLPMPQIFGCLADSRFDPTTGRCEPLAHAGPFVVGPGPSFPALPALAPPPSVIAYSPIPATSDPTPIEREIQPGSRHRVGNASNPEVF